jgi:hypothetical protein
LKDQPLPSRRSLSPDQTVDGQDLPVQEGADITDPQLIGGYRAQLNPPSVPQGWMHALATQIRRPRKPECLEQQLQTLRAGCSTSAHRKAGFAWPTGRLPDHILQQIRWPASR